MRALIFTAFTTFSLTACVTEDDDAPTEQANVDDDENHLDDVDEMPSEYELEPAFEPIPAPDESPVIERL